MGSGNDHPPLEGNGKGFTSWLKGLGNKELNQRVNTEGNPTIRKRLRSEARLRRIRQQRQSQPGPAHAAPRRRWLPWRR